MPHNGQIVLFPERVEDPSVYEGDDYSALSYNSIYINGSAYFNALDVGSGGITTGGDVVAGGVSLKSLNSNKADIQKMTIFTPCIGGETSYYCEASYKYGITPVSNTITRNELFSSLVPGDVSLHPIESGIYRFEIVLCESGVTMSTNGYTVLYLTSNSSAEAVYSKSYGPGSICYRHIFCAYLNAGTSYALHYQRHYSSYTVWGDGSIASAVITKIRN